MIPPTILVGVGGQGAKIAAEVLDRLHEHAAESRDPARMREMIDRYVAIFAVDTKRELSHNRLKAGNVFELAPTNTDATIARLLQSNDFFQKWWPEHIGRVGNFFDGAGALRAKGRLAYWLQGSAIAPAVKAQLTNLRPVWAGSIGSAMSQDQPAFVFVVGSLAGGTGSGIILSLAMHLRRELTGQNVQIVGAFPLASIMESGPAAFQRPYVWGNVSSALREIDWWQIEQKDRPKKIRSFFPLHGEQSAASDSQERPFDLVYLFTKANRNGKSLGDFDAYSRLIADCLAMDISSPVTAQNRSSFSNFIGVGLGTRRQVATKAGPRSIEYGSVGSASITYPVADISRYLGHRLVANLLERDFLTPASRDTEAIDWAIQNRLEERGSHNDVFDALVAPIPDSTGGRDREVGRAPSPLSELESARKGDVRETVRKFRQRVEGAWLPDVEQHADRNMELILADKRNAIRAKLLGYLNGTDSEGYEKATEMAAAIIRVLKANRQDVREELQGDDKGRRGKRSDLERLEAQYKDKPSKSTGPGTGGVVQSLEDGYGRISLRPGKATRDARDIFMNAWWTPWLDARKYTVLADRVLRIYDELIESTESFARVMYDITATLERRRGDILQAGQGILGKRRSGAALVLEDRVLDDPLLVDRLFDRKIQEELTNGAGIARKLTSELGTLITTLETATIRSDTARSRRIDDAVGAALDVALTSAAREFRPDVATLSIWEALVEEHRIRIENEHFDELIASTYGRIDAQTYVQQRVEQCVARAVPFWRLDDATLSAHPEAKPARDGGLFLSRDAIDRCTELPGLQETLQSVAQQAGLSFQAGEFSDHRFVVSQREAGVPLFAIDGSEIARMIDGEAEVTQSRSSGDRNHLYIDQRYANALPPDLTIGSSVAGRDDAANLVGLGFRLGIVRYGGSGEKINRGVIEWAVDTQKKVWEPLGAGIVKALDRLTGNEGERDELRARIQRELNKLPASQHHVQYGEARRWAEDERDHAPKDRGDTVDPRRAAYTEIAKAVDAARLELR